jgi:hypothetical protein
MTSAVSSVSSLPRTYSARQAQPAAYDALGNVRLGRALLLGGMYWCSRFSRRACLL